MSTGQIEWYRIYNCGECPSGKRIDYDDHIKCIAELEKRIESQLKLLDVAGKRIAHLESLLPDEA